MTGSSALVPVAAATAALAMLSALDAVVKELAGAFPVGQVVTMRFLAGTVMIALVVVLKDGPFPTRAGLRRAMVRAIAILATSLLFYKTLALLPLAEAVAITFVSPFLMLLVSRLLLGEPVTSRAVGAIAIGFVGVLVMLAGNVGLVGGGDPLGYLTGLAAALAYAFALILTRRDTVSDPVLALVLSQNLGVTILSVPFAVVGWTTPDLGSLGLVLVAGAFGTAGHVVLAWAYARAPAARLAPLEYTAFVWAAGLGWLLFDELPTAATLAGAALIGAGCLAAARTSKPSS